MDSHPEASRGGVDLWAELAFEELTVLPDVSRVGMALLEGGGRRLLFTASDRARGTEDTWCHVDAYAPVPLNDAISAGAPLTGALDDLDPRFESFVRAQDGTGYVAVAAVPFAADSQALGGFVLYYTRPQEFGAEQDAELRDIADRIADRLVVTLQQPGAPATSDYRPPQGSRVVERVIPPDPAAVGQARRFLGNALADWSVDEETTAHAVLCLSELVTNALIHTGGGCRVQVELHEGVLTTRVHDNGSTLAPPVTAPRDSLRGYGHGLQLVDALASRWGRTTDPQATAWFALDVH